MHSSELRPVVPDTYVIPINEVPQVEEESCCKAFFNKVLEITIIGLKTLALLVLAFLNPVIFALGFIIGVVWDQDSRNFPDEKRMDAQRIIDEIDRLVTQRKLLSGFILVCGAFIALPVTLGSLSAYGGMRLGRWMSHSEDERLERLLVDVRG